MSWQIEVRRDVGTPQAWVFTGQGPSLVDAIVALLRVLEKEHEVMALLERKAGA